jgi:type II secretory pathway component PulK
MWNSGCGARQELYGKPGERGIALITVLLVTALLMALIFEFAYGTRVSLRAAVNFRDSQRAYFLARSGISVFGRFKQLQDYMPQQGEWYPPPVMLEPDTTLALRWEDEAGKIKITDVQTNVIRQQIVEGLFQQKDININLAVLNRMKELNNGIDKLGLLTGLQQYMTDEEYTIVNRYLTVQPNVNNININTAPEAVLLSLGISGQGVGLIVEDRAKAPISNPATHPAVQGLMIPGTTSLISNFLTDKSDILSVSSQAVVGGYTKQVDAVITRLTTTGQSSANYTINYWRAF